MMGRTRPRGKLKEWEHGREGRQEKGERKREREKERMTDEKPLTKTAKITSCARQVGINAACCLSRRPKPGAFSPTTLPST